MLRKFIRKVLPSHESVLNNRHVARLGPRLLHHSLWHLNRRSVAGGVAAGMFAGLIPGSNPVQFSAGALLAIAFRVNLPLSVLVTLYSNPFTIVPLYYVAFRIGQLVLLQSGGTLPEIAWNVDWLISVGKPLLIGVPLLAIVLAAISYFLIDWAWRLSVCWQWSQRRRRRENGK